MNEELKKLMDERNRINKKIDSINQKIKEIRSESYATDNAKIEAKERVAWDYVNEGEEREKLIPVYRWHLLLKSAYTNKHYGEKYHWVSIANGTKEEVIETVQPLIDDLQKLLDIVKEMEGTSNE